MKAELEFYMCVYGKGQTAWRIIFLLASAAFLCAEGDVEISPLPRVIASEFENVTLTCSYSAKIVRLMWKNSSTTITVRGLNCQEVGSVNPLYRHLCPTERKFTLTILNVTREQHENDWWCLVYNNTSGQYESSLHTKIFVEVPVTAVNISPETTPLYVTENNNVSFTCSTSEARPQSTIEWFLFSNRTHSLLGKSVSTPDNRTLTITRGTLSYRFQRSQTGSQIYCTAGNIKDRPGATSNFIEVIVRYPPDGGPFIDGYINGSSYEFIASEEQSLVCVVKGGFPKPTLTWNCYSGETTTINAQGEVRTKIRWKAMNHNNGTCICTSNQEQLGEINVAVNTIALYSPSLPTFVVNGSNAIKDDLAEIRGRSVDVVCFASSYPRPNSYVWTHLPNGATSNSQTLRLQNIQSSLEGQYRCEVTNKMEPSGMTSVIGTNHSMFILEVLHAPDPPKLTYGTHLLSGLLSVILGDDVNLTCSSVSKPNPYSYTWKGPRVSYSSQVVMENIKVSEKGTYICNVSNKMVPTIGEVAYGSAESTVSIDVMTPPTDPKLMFVSETHPNIQLKSDKLSVKTGTNFSLKCSSTSNPPPMYRWSGMSSAELDTIRFTKISTAASGQLSCNVENTMKRTFAPAVTGQATRTIEIDVLYPPVISEIENRTLHEYDNLLLNCSAQSNPPPSLYQWKTSNGRYQSNFHTFTISSVTREDTAIYTCIVENEMALTGESNSVRGENSIDVAVRVLYHPDVLVSKANRTTITEGDLNVMLLCSATGEPEPRISKWIHYAPDGKTIVAEYSYDSDNASQAYFKLANTSYMDSGLYQCFAYNGISDFKTGDSEATNYTSLLVRARPVVIIGEKDVASATRTNASLSVIFYSNDGNCSITWYRIKNDTRHSVPYEDGVFKVENSDIVVNVTFHRVPVQMLGNKTELFIQNISDSHFGEYEAVISNSINTTVWRVNFDAQSGPDIPRQFKAVRGSITDSSVIFTWISGFHGGADQTFYIQFKTPISPWENISMINGWMKTDTAFNTTVDELIPETSYSFRIFSTNEFSRSGFSTAVNVTTMRTRTAVQPDDSSKLIGPAIGGGVAGVLILSIVALVIILWRRNYTGGLAGRHNAKLLNGNKRSEETADNDNLAEVQNPMYESAGPHPISSMNTDVYAQVDKTKKIDYTTSDSKRDVYSQVQKLHKSDSAKFGKEKEQAADLYAMPVKAKGKQVHQKKEKKLKQEKKAKQGKMKGKLHGHINEGILYENTEEFRSRTTDPDNAYELTCAESQLPSRTKNPDGLIYVEVDLPRNKDKKDNTPIVIHGLEDRNDYAEIAFGKVGEPAPDSDDEQIPKDDAKDN